jgi:peptidoglycan/LPS O-acetylase OafA/YrhL
MGSFTGFVSQKLFEYSLSKRETSLLNILAIISVLSFFFLIPSFYNNLAGSNFAHTAFHNDFLKLALLSCVLLISVIHGDGLIKLIMQSKIFVFWGNVSFSAYLGHM